MNRVLSRFWVPILTAAVFFGAPSFAEFYTDWLWFGETGYREVFLRSLAAKSLLGTSVAGLVIVFLYGNARTALRGLRRRELRFETELGPRTIAADAEGIRLLAATGAVLAGLLLGVFASSRWESALLWFYATPFGKQDPIFGRELAFYVFQLPFLLTVQGLLKASIALALVVATGGPNVTGGLGRARRGVAVAHRPPGGERARRGAGLLVVLAFGAYLEVPASLTEAAGIVHGASNADVAARLPALRLLIAAAFTGAALFLYQATTTTRFWPSAAAVALYVVVALGGRGYTALVQRFVVAPNEQVKETPFILHNIAGTRAAFGLDAVEERSLPGDAPLTREDIDRNAATLKNVPLWDHQPLLDTFGQIQEIRTYYDFASVDNDRYKIDGEYRQVMLSAREVNSASLPNRNWINERLTFTHGYGLTLGPVNQVTPEGLPVLFIRNLPPESSVPELRVDEPSLYYGELSNDHVFVKTRTKEFHYPKGDDNVTTTYAGEGGVAVDSLFRKLLFSIRFRSIKTLLSNDFTAESRILFHRRISERVRRIAPFLVYDPDPYLALSGGRLVWIQDAYTTSATYPYSTPVGGINYIRNSVKVVIDAYHGRTVFYRIDDTDPVAASFAKAFPALFRPMSEMPEDLRNRLRYPEGIFSIQAAVFSTYHMMNPAVFYNKEDQWEVPAIDDASEQPVRMRPYYTIMKLPRESGAEFLQMLPFTPRQKDNLAAWMVARSDGEHYGKLMAFQFPKQKVVFGPRQVVARINQDQVISPQITLWNQQGSHVIQGTLLVIPIEESLLYIRPLYLKAAGGRIPELKRVIVAYQNQIAMEETLEAALERIFPRRGAERGGTPEAASTTSPTAAAGTPTGGALEALAIRAREHYQRALQAQRDGDWARYGEEIKRLGEALEQMKAGR